MVAGPQKPGQCFGERETCAAISAGFVETFDISTSRDMT